jgi:hypothetical protein
MNAHTPIPRPQSVDVPGGAAGGAVGGAVGGARGFVLPLALLLVASLSALAVAFHGLAEANRVMLEWDLEAFALAWRSRLESGPQIHGDREPLGFGYALVRTGTSRGGRMVLEWTLDPSRIAAEPWIPRGVVAEGFGPEDLLAEDLLAEDRLAEDGSPAGGGGAAPFPLPWRGERLGPWTSAEWLRHLGGAPLPGEGSGRAVVQFGTFRVEGRGVRILGSDPSSALMILAPNGVEVSGEGVLRAVILASGSVQVDAAVVWVGGGRVEAFVPEPGWMGFVLDPAVIQGALTHLEGALGGNRVIPASGGHLGWWAP